MVDYSQLGRLCLLLCDGDQGELIRMVRLAMFNVVFRNDDDHLKNLAWLYDGVRWRLSPAYDLTFSPLPDRSSPVGGHTRDVPREALLALGTGLGLRLHEASGLLEQVLASAATVRTVLRAYDCTGPASRLAEQTITNQLDALRN